MADVVVLLGAGASKDAGLPDVKELVTNFHATVTGRQKTLLDQITAALEPSGAVLDVERLLDALDQLSLRDQQVLSAFVRLRGWTKGATSTSADYNALRDRLYSHIREQLALTPERTRYLDPLIKLARLHGGMDIFSLNYDLAIETACTRLGVPYTDGFDPLWNSRQFEDARFTVRLHKLHGSLMWYRLPDGSIEKIQVAPDAIGGLRHFAGHALEPALIYPASAGKDIHVDPYATLVERLRAVLDDSRFLVCIGYSFRDRHIKSVVLEKLRTNPHLHLVVVDPGVADTLERSDLIAAPAFRGFDGRIIPWAAPAHVALWNNGARDHLEHARFVADQVAASEEERRASTPSSARSHLTHAAIAATDMGWMRFVEPMKASTPGRDMWDAAVSIATRDVSAASTLAAQVALLTATHESIRTAAAGTLAKSLRPVVRGMVYTKGGTAVIAPEPAAVASDEEERARYYRQRATEIGAVESTILAALPSARYHLSEASIESIEWLCRALHSCQEQFWKTARVLPATRRAPFGEGRGSVSVSDRNGVVAVLPREMEDDWAMVPAIWTHAGVEMPFFY